MVTVLSRSEYVPASQVKQFEPRVIRVIRVIRVMRVIRVISDRLSGPATFPEDRACTIRPRRYR